MIISFRISVSACSDSAALPETERNNMMTKGIFLIYLAKVS
jgi:hypothetical protein